MNRRTSVLLTTTAAVALVGLAAPVFAIQPATTPLGAAGGVRYKMATIQPDGDGPAATGVTAGCDDGWDAVSGGQTIGTAPNQGIADSWAGQDTYWYTGMWYGPGVDARLDTFAVCLKDPELSTSKQIAPDLPADSEVHRDVFCPDGGAITGGVFKTGDPSDFSLNASFPIDSAADIDTLPDDGWRSYVDYSGDGGDSVHFTVSCLKNAVLSYKSSTVSVLPGAALSTKAVCPKNSPVVGGGVYVQGTASMAHVFTSRPWDGKDTKKVPEDGWRGGVVNTSPTSLSMTVHAVCRQTPTP